MPPLAIPRLMVNAASSQISMHFGLTGPTFTVASACASATHAIGIAFQMVRSGAVSCAVTGGAEASIAFGPLKLWEAMRIMAPDACRPFSKDRNGMILGEGAGILVIEALDAADARGAEILGEIVGFGMSADAKDITNPDEAGMARAMDGALVDAGLGPQNIQYVNAHGSGTVANDETETKAIKRVFGAHADTLAISSTKSMIGHALGACGALELIATLMGMRESVAPPTIGYLGPVRRATSITSPTRRERRGWIAPYRTRSPSAASTRCWRCGGSPEPRRRSWRPVWIARATRVCEHLTVSNCCFATDH